MNTDEKTSRAPAGTQGGPEETRRFRVYRYKRGAGGEHFDEFEVPVGPNTTVLDALRWIQRHLDPSLAVRHSCLHASCGTCGMQVDGREELACVCSVQDHGAEITAEPLANLPVLTDLVVEMNGFFARFPHAHPIIRSSGSQAEGDDGEIHLEGGHEVTLELPGPLHYHPLHHHHRAAPPGADFVRLEDCIECGLCLSACPVAATSHDYAGPAALAAAERLLEEPRGVEREDVLAWAGRPEGVWRCHVGLECTRACPADALPAERIMALRRELMFGKEDDKECEP
ncbi:MAG: succinate dehydrogenase/fumarate reductase iron-sulfur subunit [Solirubrobacterales bacterium]|nr:succinate dehydrogenase/fumarate reductase iron-sulfur subunit [Solirubrobacterales bacterium]